MRTVLNKLNSKFLWIMVFIIMIPLIMISSIQIVDIQRILLSERKEDMKHNVQIVFGVLEQIHKKETLGILNTEEAQTLAKELLGNVRFNSNGYIWVISNDGFMVRHPIATDLDGKNLIDLPDPTGSKIWVESINITRTKGEGYINYQWPKPGSSEKLDKISFIRAFEPWGWIVGTGIYKEGVDIVIKDYLHDNLFIGIITLIISIFMVSCMLTKIEFMMINNSKNDIKY